MVKPINKHSINYIVILNIIGTVSYQAVNFLLTPILTRALGTHDFGVITLYTSWVNILVPVISLNLVSVIALVMVNVKLEEQNCYITSLVGLELLAVLAAAILAGVFQKSICNFLQFEPIVLLLLLIQCFGTMLVQFIIAYFVQVQKTVLQFSFSISISIASFLITVGLLNIITDPKQKYLCRIIGYAFPYFIGGLIVLIILKSRHSKWFCIDVWKWALPISIPFIFHTLSHMALSQSGKIVLQRMEKNGMECAGFFGFAVTIASIMHVIWTALNNAWLPYYYRLLACQKVEQIQTSLKRYMSLYTGGFMMFSLISSEITNFMGGKQYLGSNKLVLGILPAIYFMFMYSFPVNYKTFHAKTVSIAAGTIIAALANIVLCILLVPRFSYWGSIISMVISYGILFLIHQITVIDKSHQYFCSFFFFAKGFACALCSCLFAAIFLDMPLLRWTICAILGLGLLVKIILQKSLF